MKLHLPLHLSTRRIKYSTRRKRLYPYAELEQFKSCQSWSLKTLHQYTWTLINPTHPVDSALCSPVTNASITTRPSSLHGLAKHKHKLGVKTKTLPAQALQAHKVILSACSNEASIPPATLNTKLYCPITRNVTCITQSVLSLWMDKSDQCTKAVTLNKNQTHEMSSPTSTFTFCSTLATCPKYPCKSSSGSPVATINRQCQLREPLRLILHSFTYRPLDANEFSYLNNAKITSSKSYSNNDKITFPKSYSINFR